MGMETASLSNPSQAYDIARSTAEECTKNRTSHEHEQRLTIGRDFRHNNELRRFSRHCQSFYNSSLVITGSSPTSLDKNYGNAMSNNDREVSQGKIVMEALDRIGALRAAVEGCRTYHPAEFVKEAQESLKRLRTEHELIVERHGDVLDECGLRDINRFIDLGSSTTNPCCFEQYIQTRDEIRRASHKLAMLQRQASLHQILSDHEGESSTHYNYETTHDTHSVESKPLTQLHHVKDVMITTENFVGKYKRNIGSHSFLAGLHRFIHEQLHVKSKNDTVQWNFRGSVLTEACHMTSEGDTEAYARDAANVLFSFLTWIKCTDVEGGRAEHDNLAFRERNRAPSTDTEPMLSFRVNKYLSNNNLRRILSVLPDPKSLDARPTGSVEIISERDRINVDGHLDEARPWWQFQLCNVL